jgi:MFS family permease
MIGAEPARRAKRNVYVFGTASFFNDIATEMAYWILPAFLGTLGAGPATLGLIEGMAESVAAVGKLIAGYLTDFIPRRKPLVMAGYGLANLVKPLLAVSTSWWHVLLIRLADRTSKGMRSTPRDVMVLESVEPTRIGNAFGLLQSMDSAGAVLGPLAAWLIMAKLGNMRAVFWLAAVPGLITVLAVLFAVETRKQAPATRIRSAAGERSRLSGRFYYVLAAVLIFSLGNSSDMFLVLRAQQIGIRPVFAPLFGLVFNVTYTAASWPAGWLSDRRSKSTIAAVGYLTFAVTYFAFAAAPGRPVLWIMMALYGFYYALTSPVLRALVAETVVPESRGRAFGVFDFSSSVVTLLSSILTGQLWKRFGAPLPFYCSSALAVSAAIMLLLGSRKRPASVQPV